MNDEELKKVTVKGKLDNYKMGLQKAAIGVGLMAVGGIGFPIVGSYMFNDPATFQTMSAVTVPLTGVYATILGVKIKKYFDMKKEANEEENDKGMSL